MVDIFKKIDEIRKKPEHIRMRYVWTMVTIFAFLIFLIWMISLKSSLSNFDQKPVEESVVKKEIIENLKESGKALNEVKKGMDSAKAAENQNIVAPEKTQPEI